MQEIIINTQAELDKLPLDQEGYIFIEGGTEQQPLVFVTKFEKAEVIVRGKAFLDVRDSATIGYVGGSATIRDVRGSATIRDVGGSATIGYVRDSATIGYVRDSATIRDVGGSATIGYVGGSATIRDVGGSATIGYVRDSATIRDVGGSATIGYVGGSATIRDVGGSATIGYVGGSATIRDVRDSATIELSGEAVITSATRAKRIVCRGYNTVVVHKSDKSKLGLVMNKESHLVVIPDYTLNTEPTFAEYAIRYGIRTKGTKATLYKAVHKRGSRYFSHASSSFEYIVGEVKTDKCNPSKEESCTFGLHVAPLDWATRFGNGWSDIAILECEVSIKQIVVSKDCDGKVRTPELKVVRELDKNEYTV